MVEASNATCYDYGPLDFQYIMQLAAHFVAPTRIVLVGRLGEYVSPSTSPRLVVPSSLT